MNLIYMDESGDEAIGVFTALSIPVERWAETFARIKEFRRAIYSSDGIRPYKELHAWRFVSGRGDISKSSVAKSRRCVIFNDALQLVAGLPGACLFNAVYSQTKLKEQWAFERMLTRINTNMTKRGSHAIIICDQGKESKYTRIRRKLGAHNPIPSQRGAWENGAATKNLVIDRIVEDIVYRDSKDCNFVQLVDFCAYALLRRERPLPSKNIYGLNMSFGILAPILCREASARDAEGIVRVP